jgi:hypothetical protein
VNLLDGSPAQKWPIAGTVAGIGVVAGVVWTGTNPFDGGAGALIAHDNADGAATTTVDMTGIVRTMATCVAGTTPEGGPPDTGGGSGAP